MLRSLYAVPAMPRSFGLDPARAMAAAATRTAWASSVKTTILNVAQIQRRRGARRCRGNSRFPYTEMTTSRPRSSPGTGRISLALLAWRRNVSASASAWESTSARYRLPLFAGTCPGTDPSLVVFSVHKRD